MPEYENPPVVEAWIAFDFEPHTDKTAWDIKQIDAFTKVHSNDFKRIDVLIKEEYELEQTSAKELPRITQRQHIIDVARMFNGDDTRIRQLGEDRIAYNLLRKAGDEYPGFEVLLEETIAYLNQYLDYFHPPGIKMATIHYVDIIDIPMTVEPLVLTEFFEFIPDIPQETFGLTIGYTLAFATKCPFDEAPLNTSLILAPPPNARTLRVRLDWEKTCPNINFHDEQELRDGLKRSKEFMVDCFERMITDKTRALFNPA